MNSVFFFFWLSPATKQIQLKILYYSTWIIWRNRIADCIAPWLMIYHAMQYSGNAWVLCTRDHGGLFLTSGFFKSWQRLIACIALLLYGSSLCIMRWGCSGCAWDWDRPHGACQNPEHWSVHKHGFLRRPSLTQHTGLD
jgi:hypothetical protein